MASSNSPTGWLKEAYASAHPIYNSLLLILLPSVVINTALSLALIWANPSAAVDPLASSQAHPVPLFSWLDVIAIRPRQLLIYALIANVVNGLVVAPITSGASIVLGQDQLEDQQPTVAKAFQQAFNKAWDLILSGGLSFLVFAVAFGIQLGLALLLLQYPWGLIISQVLGFVLITYLSIHLLFVRYPILLKEQAAFPAFIAGWQLTMRHWQQVLAGYLLITTGLSIIGLIPGLVINPPSALGPILQAPPIDPTLLRMVLIVVNQVIGFLFAPVVTMYYLIMYRQISSQNQPPQDQPPQDPPAITQV